MGWRRGRAVPAAGCIASRGPLQAARFHRAAPAFPQAARRNSQRRLRHTAAVRRIRIAAPGARAAESVRALHQAIDRGVNFIDTADVYGDGRSERLIAKVRAERPRDRIIVATKAGRRLPAQVVEGYSRENLTGWVERSLTNLKVDALDLLQLHCPPTEMY